MVRFCFHENHLFQFGQNETCVHFVRPSWISKMDINQPYIFNSLHDKIPFVGFSYLLFHLPSVRWVVKHILAPKCTVDSDGIIAYPTLTLI